MLNESKLGTPTDIERGFLLLKPFRNQLESLAEVFNRDAVPGGVKHHKFDQILVHVGSVESSNEKRVHLDVFAVVEGFAYVPKEHCFLILQIDFSKKTQEFVLEQQGQQNKHFSLDADGQSLLAAEIKSFKRTFREKYIIPNYLPVSGDK